MLTCIARNCYDKRTAIGKFEKRPAGPPGREDFRQGGLFENGLCTP
jgi:hypothetical protein